MQDISKYHHFIFNQEQPGTIYVQKSIGSELLMVDIIKDLCNINQVLERKNPIGLSAERKKYLSKEVSKFL